MNKIQFLPNNLEITKSERESKALSTRVRMFLKAEKINKKKRVHM